MPKVLTAPETNDRAPRYMERALAAIHEAQHEPVTFRYATHSGRVGLFVESAERVEKFVCAPIAANYPHCTLTTVAGIDEVPTGWETWHASLRLSPECYPILRPAQFEDLL